LRSRLSAELRSAKLRSAELRSGLHSGHDMEVMRDIFYIASFQIQFLFDSN
jgi:hypothetical protein